MSELTHLEAIEQEYEQIESTCAWNQVYQKVRVDGQYDFELTEAKSPINRPLNRYRDVMPCDHSRIILKHPSTDYINASLVKVESINRQYILTQGPLSQTTPHFWLMVWQQQCRGIVMLNKVVEKNMIKCHQYWPLGENNGASDTMNFPSVGLTVDLMTEVKHYNYIYRTLRLTEDSSKTSREILHFHYTTWPDFGVPQSPAAFNKFLGVVIKSGCLEADVGPAIVHCSAGIGRSGTFCLVDSLLIMLERGLCSSNVGTVLEVLLDMRRYRMGLIQTPDQLRFSYRAIVEAASKRLRQPITNGNGSVDSGSSSSSNSGSCENLNDVPPPPPRSDSLTRSMVESQLRDRLEGSSSDEDSDTDGDDTLELVNTISDETVPERSLPAVPDDSSLPTTPLNGNGPSSAVTDNMTEDKPPPRPLRAVPDDNCDTPPPRPPPARNVTSNGNCDDDTPPPRPPPARGNDDTPPPRPPPARGNDDTPPPRPPPARSTLSTQQSPEQLAATMASEVRRRRQADRKKSILDKVTSIKAKREAAEAWEYRKRGSSGQGGRRAGKRQKQDKIRHPTQQ